MIILYIILILLALITLAVVGLLLLDPIGQKICRLYVWFLTRKF